MIRMAVRFPFERTGSQSQRFPLAGGNVHHAQAQSAPRIVAIPACAYRLHMATAAACKLLTAVRAAASLSTALEMLERAEQRQSQRQRERADAGDSRGRKRARVAANASSDDDSGGGRQPWQQLRALKPAASTDASSGGLSGSSRSMVLRTCVIPVLHRPCIADRTHVPQAVQAAGAERGSRARTRWRGGVH